MVSLANQLLHLNLNQQVLGIIERCIHLNHLKQLQCFLTTLGHNQNQFYAFKLVRFCNLKLSNFTYARHIFDHVVSPNIYLYTAMITAYASHPDHHLKALSLYCDMLRRGCPQPNQFIYPHVLKSCPEVLELSGTKMVHAQIMKSGFVQYPVVQTAIVYSYARLNDNIGNARKLFDEMSERNVVSWTAMISGYTRVGDVDNAVSLFEEMPDRDVPSWNSVIAGFTQNGLFPEAISFFRRMVVVGGQSKDIRPNQVTVVCVLSACGHTGMLQIGKLIHGYVYRNGLVPDLFVLNALLDIRADLAEFAVKKLIEIDPNNGGYGIMLANLYGESGKWDEVGKVRKTLKDRNAIKVPGCSWIEIDKQVNMFYSVDKTHPKTEEIYDTLESLICHLFQLAESSYHEYNF
ncbi:hypothetical protein Q3G72_034275 [Acer saccharum]|nr:hypothetical protein Q3G72_034275 [Acer saccharum]